MFDDPVRDDSLAGSFVSGTDVAWKMEGAVSRADDSRLLRPGPVAEAGAGKDAPGER